MGYKGMKDLILILLFKAIMSPFKMLWNKKDEMLFNFFSATLHNLTNKWFNDLKHANIYHFFH